MCWIREKSQKSALSNLPKNSIKMQKKFAVLLLFLVFQVNATGKHKETRGERNGLASEEPTNWVKEYVSQTFPKSDMETVRELAGYAREFANEIDPAIPFGKDPTGKPRLIQNDITVTLPINLLPSPFPAELFDKAARLQRMFNELYFRVALDYKFMHAMYEKIAATDKYASMKFDMLNAVMRAKAEGKFPQKPIVMLQRADYMTHQGSNSETLEIKQIEVNIGPLGIISKGTDMPKLHAKILQKVEALKGAPLGTYLRSKMSEEERERFPMDGMRLPESNPRKRIAMALIKAWELWTERHGKEKAVIMFQYDQEALSDTHYQTLKIGYEIEQLGREHHLKVKTVSIKEYEHQLRTDAHGHLILDEEWRVAVVQIWYGQLAERWTDASWQKRIEMELSTAITSPSIGLELVSTKKVQQILSNEQKLKHYLPHYGQHQIDELLSVMAKLWGLEPGHNEEIVALAKQQPHDFVLKKEGQGGKGNLFDGELKEKLETMSPKQRSAYILMERILPVSVKNYMKRPSFEPTLEDVVPEVSIFGTMIAYANDDGEIDVIRNEQDGYAVRTKKASVNQGNMSSDGMLDSVVLFPESNFH